MASHQQQQAPEQHKSILTRNEAMFLGVCLKEVSLNKNAIDPIYFYLNRRTLKEEQGSWPVSAARRAYFWSFLSDGDFGQKEPIQENTERVLCGSLSLV